MEVTYVSLHHIGKFEKDRSEKHDACGTDVGKIVSSADHVSYMFGDKSGDLAGHGSKLTLLSLKLFVLLLQCVA
jgi:hypothetical protein